MNLIPTTAEANKFLLQGSLALAKMEHSGVKVDEEYLDQAIQNVTMKIHELEGEMQLDDFYKTWKKVYGGKLKLGSYEQIGKILFQHMGYESKEKTPTGRDKASKNILEKIDHPFVRKFIKVQNLKKSLSTYLEGIKKELVNGKVHPDYGLNHIVSFRSGCRNPNFQNQPARDEEMADMVRRCYIPRRGRRLVEVDLVGAEVKVAACYNKDPNLIKYIKDPATDMHRDMAMQIYKLSKDQVEKKTSRDWSKNRCVFPFFYGSVYFQCAPHLWEPVAEGATLADGTTFNDHLKSKGIKRLGDCEAGREPRSNTFAYHLKQIEKDFWDKRFPVYKKWKNDWYDAYLKSGDFTMYTGFTCRGVMKKNDVTNYPVQGASFHCILWCIIQMQKWLDKYKMKSLQIGEIHDSDVGDVTELELQDYINFIVELITVKLPKAWPWIIVPMAAEVKVSEVDGNWAEMTEYVDKGGGNWGPK